MEQESEPSAGAHAAGEVGGTTADAAGDGDRSAAWAGAGEERPSFRTRAHVYNRIGAQPDPVGEAPGQGVAGQEGRRREGDDALDAEREKEETVDVEQYGDRRPTANNDGDGKAKPVYPKPRPSSKVCILSIDGGGVRGIIPSRILTRLEQLLAEKSGDPDAKVADYFDLVAGTSAGGILAVTLLAPNEAGRPMFSAAEAGTFFTQNATTIFPRKKHSFKFWRTVRNIFRPAYRARPLEKLLDSYLTTPDGKTLTLKDMLRPVLITSYDILHARPVFFFCQRARLSPSHDYKLTSVCRATSAAPALFPPARIESVDRKNRRVCIDGGVIANNPTLAAVHHVLANTADFPISLRGRRSCRDMLVLSIGAGQDETTLEYEQTRKWGMAKWAGALLDIRHDFLLECDVGLFPGPFSAQSSSMPPNGGGTIRFREWPSDQCILPKVMVFGSSNMTHYQLCNAFDSEDARDNYLRIETTKLPKQSKVLDNTHPNNITRLTRLADQCLQDKARVYDPEAGHLVQLEQTNEQRLEWFAEQLVKERAARMGGQPPGEHLQDVAAQAMHKHGLARTSSNVDAAQAYQQ